jgi:hypothetical protein
MFERILDSYYAFEYKQADKRCAELGSQLTSDRAVLGASWECTARYFCIARCMIRFAMGYRNYPPDLPFNKPYLDPLPELNAPMTDEYIVHRIVSGAFLYWEVACVTGGEPGWTTNRFRSLVGSICTFMVRVLPRFALDNQEKQPISDLTVSSGLDSLPGDTGVARGS